MVNEKGNVQPHYGPSGALDLMMMKKNTVLIKTIQNSGNGHTNVTINSNPLTVLFSNHQPEHNSPIPSDLVRGLLMLARVRAKRLAARDAFDLV